MAQREVVRRVPTRVHAPRGKQRIEWTVPFSIAAAASALAISFVAAIVSARDGLFAVPLAFAGYGSFLAGCAAAIGLRQHRRERHMWSVAWATDAISNNRFRDALDLLLAASSSRSRLGAADWLTAYAALHDGQVDHAIRLTTEGLRDGDGEPKTARPAFRALRALAHAVKGNQERAGKDIAAVRRSRRLDPETAELTHALCRLAEALTAQVSVRQIEREVEDALPRADAALLRSLRLRRAEPYRIPEEDDGDVAANHDDSHPAIQNWIAIAHGRGEGAVSSSRLANTKQQNAAFRYRRTSFGGFLAIASVSLPVGVVILRFAADGGSLVSLGVWMLVTLGFFIPPMLQKLPSVDQLPLFLPHLTGPASVKKKKKIGELDPAERKLRSELVELLSRANDLEALRESAAALALADKCIWRIDSGSHDWAAEEILPGFIAVRARSLALLGNHAEADHEIGELRKHFVDYAPAELIEWQVDLRSAFARGDHAQVRALAEHKTLEERTSADSDLIFRSSEADVEEADEDGLLKRAVMK
jgi:hypothetical protein